MQGNWEAAIRKAVERKMKAAVEDGCKEVVAIFEGWIVNWSEKPSFSYEIEMDGGLNASSEITVDDFEVAPGVTRWEAIDKGTSAVSIDQLAEGRNWPMRFPFTQPYPAKSIAADGSGGGEGRVGPMTAPWKISNRSIKARGWTTKIKELHPRIKVAMKRGFDRG